MAYIVQCHMIQAARPGRATADSKSRLLIFRDFLRKHLLTFGYMS